MPVSRSCILLINNHLEFGKTLVDMLHGKGHTVLTSDRGEAGLVLLQEHSVDLLLIDFDLPDISGLELLNRVKTQHPETEVIVLAGNATPDTAITAIHSGAFSFLAQPYVIEQILQQLNRAIQKQQSLKSLRLSQKAIDSCSNGIMILDATFTDASVSYVNPAFERLSGYSADKILEQKLEPLLTKVQNQPGLEEIRAALREKRDGHALIQGNREDGSELWYDFKLSPIRNDRDGASHFICILNDSTEAKRYREQLEYQANHDKLTGLPNRNLLLDRVHQILSHASRYNRNAAVLFVGLDNFKIINDCLGYAPGDQLLKIMAKRLTECVRATDTVARYSGDEFVVILSGLIASEDAAKVAEKISALVKDPCNLMEDELIVTCSIGISLFPKDGKETQSLLNHAQVAMHRAKKQGQGDYQFYAKNLNDQAVARMTMEKFLRHALDRRELLLHFQPQVSLISGRIIGMEALLRWQSPELGFISPGQFIPLAEETGLIIPIGEWVLRQACTQAKVWQKTGFPPLVVAVNLSPRQFREKDLVLMISRVLRETGLEPQYLELEVVESMVMHDVDCALTILNEFQRMGIKLAMDDFGTGYSSLNHLKRFPFQKLKIDRSFVRDITSDPDNAVLARAIIAMGHSLNLGVTAEGVETEGQLQYLRSQGCDEMQGFYFSRPVPADEFETMLRQNRQLDLATEEDFCAGRTLLLVDDEPNVLAALKRILIEDGYRVLAATSAAEGFELLATNPIGVVISDMYMPKMNGTEFLDCVKELHPQVIRIMLSGCSDMSVLTEAINRGAIFKYLSKPWKEGQLRKSVREAFRRYNSEDPSP